MRTMAFIAFFALQLSAFTCATDIHLHVVDSDMGHMTEHFHDKGQHQQDNVDDQGCHIHASHTFDVSDTQQNIASYHFSLSHPFILSELNLKSIPLCIEHPPKLS